MERNEPAASAADDGTGIPADMVEDNPAAATTEGDAPDPAAEAEKAFALRMGWRDKDEHLAKGRPVHAWLDAKSYIEKQQREAPLLRSQLRKQDDTIARQERLLKEQGEALKEILERDRQRDARGFDYARDHVKQRMRKAVADADTQAFADAERELEELDKMKPVPKEAKKPDANARTNDPPPADPAAIEWTERNPWFFSDKKLNRIARGLEEALLEEKPHLSTADRLTEVSDEVKRRYPEKFENGARNNPPTAARPGPQGVRPASGAKKTKTFDDIPAAERDAAKTAFAMIQRRTPALTAEQYLKDYFK